MRRALMGMLLAVGISGATALEPAPAHAAAAAPEVTVQSVFRMPKPEAIGAAVGAVTAVQVAMWLRRRHAKKRDGRP